MLVVGAGGLVLQLLDDLIIQLGAELTFWTDQSQDNKYLAGKFSIISTDQQVKEHFESTGNHFIVAVGSPQHRRMLVDKFESLGGELITFISPGSDISKFASIGTGCLVLHGSIIEAGAILDRSVLVNTRATITHETRIGEFSEIGPGVVLAGKVSIGKNCFIGAGATIIPKVVVEDNAIIGAGAVVIGIVKANDTVMGVPAKSTGK